MENDFIRYECDPTKFEMILSKTIGNGSYEQATIKEEPIMEQELSENKPNIIYKKRSRIQYTQQQLHILESTFQLHHYPTVDIVDNLADGLKLPTQKISVWFQNRRSRMKKESKQPKKISNNQHQQLKPTNHTPPPLSPTCFSPSPPPLSPMIEEMYQNTWNKYRYSSDYSQPLYTYSAMTAPPPAHYNNHSLSVNHPHQSSYPFYNSTNFQYGH
ncbi:unnamed protein product [Didymodactylos carnosus]|uniref:Homeobox domain-containing protein n=1 Tax=Didymodactylos carnosus TaxID=1234261 RepID=A0A813XJR8_9BILA|nr:unnamed protein product [Didymodactylos carnosus]CAF0871219.1 unnamed protein product [Didymodactylos carnosus]CAF3586208.1 unnamed protein product [Didymodactylos carnosus]CAF3658533.1 unnamed protein product [Didymodactylos carnosus]